MKKWEVWFAAYSKNYAGTGLLNPEVVAEQAWQAAETVAAERVSQLEEQLQKHDLGASIAIEKLEGQIETLKRDDPYFEENVQLCEEIARLRAVLQEIGTLRVQGQTGTVDARLMEVVLMAGSALSRQASQASGTPEVAAGGNGPGQVTPGSGSNPHEVRQDQLGSSPSPAASTPVQECDDRMRGCRNCRNTWFNGIARTGSECPKCGSDQTYFTGEHAERTAQGDSEK